LDFGAGNSPFKQVFNFKDYISTDVEQNIFNSIDVLINTGNKTLPFENNEFDLVLCLDVLEHVINPKEILLELNRVLKPNCKILISIPFLFREHEYPTDFQRYTSIGINDILSKAGFKDIEIKKIGNFYYVVYLLWIGKVIKNGEKVNMSIFQKIYRKLLIKMSIFLLNSTLFQPDPEKDDSVFLSLFVSASVK